MKAFVTLASLALLTGTLALAASTQGPYRPDPWITTKTKIALLTTNDVSGTRVNVDTVAGRVTLHGKVETAAERARAEEIATQIEGVRQVRNLLQVVPDSARKATKLDDAAIGKAVKSALESDAALRDSKIGVRSVNKGVVLLDGSSSSLSAHLRAIRVATRVDGVRRVASEVTSPDMLADREIRQDEQAAQSPPDSPDRSAWTTFSDMWISTAAKVRLMADGDTPAMDINVDTENGVVTLFGIVPTEKSKAAAAAAVRQVDGVTRVDNALEVVPAAKQKVGEVRDEETLEAATNALESRDAFDDVSVDVKNGAVRLTGTVSSQSDWLMAAVTVRSSRGVRSVNNDLKVTRK